MSCFISERTLTLLLLMMAATTEGAEPSLAGRWRLDQRQLELSFEREPGGGWAGVVVGARRGEDVGHRVLHGLRYRVERGDFIGTLVMPEDGSSHAAVLRASAADELHIEVGGFLFKKTLVLRRQP